MAILGLDIGGANLKAATLELRAVSVPFAMWKHPEQLATALAELVARFPEADELAVAMTGELCDCYETKREGVNAILDAVESLGVPARIWSTAGRFVSIAEARARHLDVAAANWHALATFAGRFAPHGTALLVDTGSTTTDIIPLRDGRPCAAGRTDWERLLSGELVYRGVGRTAIHAVLNEGVCAELFATTQDAFVVLGLTPEDAANTDTADGRPLTRGKSLARLARMLGGDVETHSEAELVAFATRVHDQLLEDIGCSVHKHTADMVIVSGAGEFLVRTVLEKEGFTKFLSLNAALGPAVSACAPAYALAALAGS
ncbi:MAG: hydantoinase/oxoprolinase family protein [Gemmataceae bacterium]